MAFLKTLFGRQKPVQLAGTVPPSADPRETANFVNYMLLQDDVSLYRVPRARISEISAKLPAVVQSAFTGAVPLYLSWRLIKYFSSIYGVGFRTDVTALSSTFLINASNSIPDTQEMAEWLNRHFAAINQAEREKEPVYDGQPVPVVMRVALRAGHLDHARSVDNEHTVCQTFYTGFSAGERGGSGRVMLVGTSSLADPCHLA